MSQGGEAINIAYLSLGSNVDKERNLVAGVRLLAGHGRVLGTSAVYETAPVGNPRDPSFLNAAVVLQTPLSPGELKEQVLRRIEDELGRRRTADPNEPRTIDIDISLFNDEVLELGKRHVPDPEIMRYPHVAVPLAEVAPSYRHPETGETLTAIAARVVAQSGQPPLRRDDISLRAE